MNPSSIPSDSFKGKLLRLPLKLIPSNAVLPILQGPMRGMKWIAGSSDNGCWLGSYEQAIQDAFKENVKPGFTVYDIGAHVGYYTLLSSVIAGPAGRVYAFEPMPDNLPILRRHVALNKLKNVSIVEAAVSDFEGEMRFAAGASTSQGALDPNGELIVKTVTLDSLNHPPPNLIKMDIEGAEMRALKGAEQVLLRHKPIIILATHSYELQDECKTYLSALRYNVQELSGPGADKGHLRDYLCY